MTPCKCPRIDGYVLRRKGCPHHADRPKPAPRLEAVRDPGAEELACAWADYRKEYGVLPREVPPARKAFEAGWKAAREGDQSGVLR